MGKGEDLAEGMTAKSKLCISNMKMHERYISDLYQLAYDLHSKTETDPGQFAAFRARLKDAAAFCDRYQDAVSQYMSVCNDEKLQAEAESRCAKYNDMYYSIQVIQDSFSAEFRSEGDNKQQAKFNLPKISLSKFLGDYTGWPSFIALFNSLIHDNKELTSVQKMHYLISVLEKEPLNLVKHLELADKNYMVAYGILKDRYENKRLIADKHIELMLSLHTVNQNQLNAGLREFVNIVKENTQALQALGFDVDSWSFLLLHIMVRKLSTELRSRFELSQDMAGNSIPTFKLLIDFLENHLRVLDTVAGPKVASGSSVSSANPKSLSVISDSCQLCQGTHLLYNCERFNGMTTAQRREVVIQHKLCFNCFRPHAVKSCMSKGRCLVCNGRHHTKLHTEKDSQHGKDSSAPRDSSPEAAVSTFGSTVQPQVQHSSQTGSTMLLGTALVGVQDVNGHIHIARALLDSGSQVSIITENLAQKLRLSRSNSGVLFGLGGSNSQQTNGTVECVIHSPRDRTQSCLTTRAVVLKCITGHLPSVQLSHRVRDKQMSIMLADEKFFIPGPIDLLLGIDVYNEIFNGKRIDLGEGMPMAHSSIFGWVLMGRAPTGDSTSLQTQTSFHCAEVSHLDNTLRRFWEVEEPPLKPIQDPENLLCEKHFVESHTRDETGRFIVRLPFSPIRKPLGDTRNNALKRFFSLERKLARDLKLKEMYAAFMADYLESSHMRPVLQGSPEKRYYIPHHGVLKESSSTTKLRAVFDASAASSSGVSLNQVLLSGPKLQPNVETIILRFRSHAVVFTADIKQMYRQVRLHDEDCRYQTIFWRDSPDKPLQEFELTTVTYGMASSAYLAMRVIHEVGALNKTQFPEAARVLQEDTFVDDIVTGAKDVESAKSLQSQVVHTLAQGGFHLRKWASNREEIVQGYPTDHREVPLRFEESGDNVFKVLGVEWTQVSDHFRFQVSSLSPCNSKRQILANIARIYDPCGFLAPVIFQAKYIMQQLWSQDISWDDPLPEDISHMWNSFASGFHSLDQVSIPRYIGTDAPERCDIAGFSDASEKGYSAVVYLRVCDLKGRVNVHLLLGKTKVAPLRKRLTIPQLELSGVVLLTHLIDHARKVLLNVFQISSVLGWCDSTIALSWLRTSPHKLSTFVGNRVAQVQGLAPYIQWRHVPSQLNPADCASRGLFPTEIVQHELWWSPSWLKEEPESWPENIIESEAIDVDVQCVASVVEHLERDSVFSNLLQRYSSFSRLQRVLAWILRFIHNARNKVNKVKGFLLPRELDVATHTAIRLMQQDSFADQLKALQANKLIKGHIGKLHPFVDDEGLLRVGGRLKHSNLPYALKHPILLPKDHHLTHLVIDYHHKVYLHAGPACLVTILSQKYWIISARRVVRNLVFKCHRRYRLKATPLEPFMGNLPPSRIRQARPFLKVGIEFAGPFNIKVATVRNAKIRKAYLCVFICLAVKAIHLEVASDLSTNAFIACLQRFVSRRGMISDVYSDCGKNFQGAKRYLNEVELFVREHSAELTEGFARTGVTWHMNPPYSPHMGGIWESSVKSAKQLFKRTIGDRALTYEELVTVFTRIEGILNSRPLCPLSNDPDDLDTLTPGHFLIGQPLASLPEPDFDHTPMTRLNRWQLVQQMSQHFWRRWQAEYLHNLQQRSKWTKETPNIQLGDLVLLKDENSPPLHWRKGRVIKLHPGSDGVVRVVQLKTSSGTCLRSLSKVCPFPK